MHFCLKYYLIIIILFSNFFLSNIWIEPKDEYKIKKIELFSSKNNLNTKTATFPLTSKSLKNSKNYGFLYLSEISEFNQLIDKYFKKEQKFNSEILFKTFSDNSMIRNIDDNWNSKSSFSINNNYTNKNFSASLNLILADDYYDNKNLFLNGSHMSLTKWNLIFGFGFIDRWWGPSHHNNLILSNYSNPPPGFFLNSLEGFEFDNNLLSNLGKIDFSFFLNRLEKNRHISNPYLIGTRVTLNPINNFYLGFSRTITMGGEGRKENFDSFFKAFFEVINSDGGENQRVDDQYKNNISNQLAGFDLKYDIKFKEALASIYFQQIAEDSDTSATSPLSAYIWTFGTEYKFLKDNLLNSFTLEFTKTITEDHNKLGKNVAYEHHIYRSGYRYRGLPLGAFIDTDSKYTQLSFLKEINDKSKLKIDLFYAEPNKDIAGRNVWGSSGNPFYGLKSKYKIQVTKKLSTEFIVTISDKELIFLDKKLDKNIFGLITNYSF